VIGTSADGQFPSRLTALTTGAGNASDLTIATGQLIVRDGAEVNVSSTGSGDAANLEVAARSIRLSNQAFLSSDTKAGQGNIILDSQDLVLRRESNITTNAIGTATGGNISIDTDILAALENSDISANAEDARGGQVIIDAQGIFGTEFRERENPATSDITATSELGPQFSGTVEINTPDVDPAQGLVNLPAQPTETEVVQACQPGGSQAQSEFVITGRGGLPPTPREALGIDIAELDWVTLNPEVENRSSPAVSTNPHRDTPAQIVEAQGWIIGENGEVILTANAPTVTPNSFWQTPTDCRGVQ
jgi:large exoprotein involved in heme utilization and adhesion